MTKDKNVTVYSGTGAYAKPAFFFSQNAILTDSMLWDII